MKPYLLLWQTLALSVVDGALNFFRPCSDITNSAGISTSFMDSWWYVMHQDDWNLNTMCPVTRMKYQDTTGIFEMTYSYKQLFRNRVQQSALVRCNTVTGKCYLNWWGWLNGYTSGDTNWQIAYTSSTYDSAVIYKCELVWWLLWAACDEQF